MNKQGKLVNGKVVGGIEWTKTVLSDLTEIQGATWNPVGGCPHECEWEMTDGSRARCYAKDVALRLAQAQYPHGFEHHYFHTRRLQEPLKDKEAKRIFLDSMSDLMSRWVPGEHIEQVLEVVKQAHWHTFQLLTKNAPRLGLWADLLPGNLWPGVSSPPDWFLGKRLTRLQQEKMLHRSLSVLQAVGTRELVTWMSVEPLSWNVAPIIAQYPGALKWAVIGAASNGPKTYQPVREHVETLLEVLDDQEVPVFFKGNLKRDPWREEFPA